MPAPFSVYEFEREGFVSVWVAKVPFRQIPADYFTEHYNREDDGTIPFTQFSRDFGFDFYDHDFTEAAVNADNPKPVDALLAGHSYADSFREAVGSVATARGLPTAEFAFLMYNTDYVPARTGIEQSEWLVFVGSFNYQQT